MSYILEALKKAEAERERERGRVPDLNSQAGPVPWLQASGRRERSPLPWVAAAALAGAAALWWLLRPAAPPQSEAAVPAQALAPQTFPQQTSGQQTSAQPTSAQQAAAARESDDGAAPRHPVPEHAPEGVTPAVPDQPPLRRETSPPHPQVASVQAAGERPAQERLDKERGVNEREVNERAASVQTGSGGRDRAPAAPGQEASPRVLPLRELPLSVQGELPRLSFGGAMYSEDPASRLLIINGQVFHEGDEVQKGLRLEHIQLKSAVLSYRGYRFLVDY